jgi:ABC-type transporter MlaC component
VITESFGRYISAIYADRFDSYAGQKLEVTEEQAAPSGVMVRSQIIKASGEPVKVDYMIAPQRRELVDLGHLPRRRNQRSRDPPL